MLKLEAIVIPTAPRKYPEVPTHSLQRPSIPISNELGTYLGTSTPHLDLGERDVVTKYKM
jgi:hypothetical protein